MPSSFLSFKSFAFNFNSFWLTLGIWRQNQTRYVRRKRMAHLLLYIICGLPLTLNPGPKFINVTLGLFGAFLFDLSIEQCLKNIVEQNR